jgi:glycosyltransferase involved in cell wall biosynthesis
MKVAIHIAGNTPGAGGGEEHFQRKSIEAMSKLHPSPDITLLTDAQNTSGFGTLKTIAVSSPKDVPAALKASGADVFFTGLDMVPENGPIPYVLYVMQLYDVRQHESGKKLFGASPLKSARHAATNAAAVVVPSEFMRREVLDLLGVSLERVVVAPLGVDEAFATQQPCIVQQPYFLFVGRISERKNIPMLLEAYQRLRDEFPHDLVIVGHPSADEPDNWGPGIVRIDRVGTAQLAGLYQHSDLVLVPSRYEGSGVLVLEALKSGGRVAVGRIGGVTEVAGDAPIFINPESTDSLVAAMRRAVTETPSDRERRKKSSKQVTAGWSWEKTARQLTTAFRKAVG